MSVTPTWTRRLSSPSSGEIHFSQLKRSISGTHHAISKQHLNRYLGEFDFRYSTRKVTDTERMGMLVDRSAGVRVSYKRVKNPGV
jgi:hypothetical protein